MLLLQSIKSLCKSKLITSIITVQLVICFFTIIVAITVIRDDTLKLSEIKNVFDENKTITITNNPLVDINYEDKDFQDKVYEYYLKLINDKNIENVGFVESGTTFYGDLSQLSLFSNELQGYTHTIFMDENFYKYVGKNIKTSSGKEFSSEAFNKKQTDKVPIIISSDLSKYIKVGEVLNRKYEVLGVLDKKATPFYPHNGSVYSGINQLPDTVIVPINYKDPSLKREVVVDVCQQTFITFKSESLKKQYISSINKYFSDNKLPLKVETLLQQKSTFVDSVKYGVYVTFGLAVLLITFSFFGITGIILSALMKRNKEFGVKLALGWTIKDICNQVLIEIGLLMFFPFVISVTVCKKIINIVFQQEQFNLSISTYVYTFILVLLLTIIYSILPIKRLKKYNIVELIKDVR